MFLVRKEDVGNMYGQLRRSIVICFATESYPVWRVALPVFLVGQVHRHAASPPSIVVFEIMGTDVKSVRPYVAKTMSTRVWYELVTLPF